MNTNRSFLTALWIVLLAALVCLPAAAQGPARAVEAEAFLARTYTNARSQSLPYRLFVPEKLEPNKKYPLVLWLHGAGGNGADNLRQVSQGDAPGARFWTQPEVQRKYAAFVLAPQCPQGEFWVQWDIFRPTVALRLVMEILGAIEKEFPVDRGRIYVLGQSQGGVGTWSLIEEYPTRFAAAIILCGADHPGRVGEVAPLPIWVFHGAKDRIISVEEARRMVGALRDAGGNPRYTEYPDVGHYVLPHALAEPGLVGWLFRQRR